MTRTSKSYRSTTPKEPKESKFVIPGIVAVIASLFLLFVSMYGFKGTKFDSAGMARGRSATDMIFEQARRNFANQVDPEEATRQQLKAQIFETFQQGDAKWDKEHPESATQDYEPVVAAQEEVVMN
ncbi:hypothetical protein EC991_008733 [Linnemannia zychae]|nr:hypothetical protein EC991_008733 [Linnemannia zychae]